ncbi:carboxypeptidase regulatory-like domain-containing protein [Candidatus Poribacteria bacterium]|nr:carboxypeptidase regulatory-like domain-containing protein [Candidatus Poribacteria bacterium]
MPIREPDFPLIPLLTATNADGNYRTPTEAGSILIRVFPKAGYYVPGQNVQRDSFHSTTVDVAPDENKTGVNFILAQDHTPPTIEHDPPRVEDSRNGEAVIINSAVRLRAKITDAESGVSQNPPFPPLKGGIEGGFLWDSGGPAIFFRPAGSNLPFRQMGMYPGGDVSPSFPVSFPATIPLTLPEGGIEPGFPGVPNPEDVNEVDGPGEAQATPPAIVRPDFEFYEAYLSGSDVGAAGVEYYIHASDRAGNSATHPSDAPSTLHRIEVKPSDYIISGRLRTPDDKNVAGATIFAHSAEVPLLPPSPAIPVRLLSTQTESLEDGTYTLHLPSAGKWEIGVIPPPHYFLVDQGKSPVVVEVVQPGVYDGNDFILAEDLEPPVIEHNPASDVTAGAVGDDVIIKARIKDNSGHVYANLVLLPIDREKGFDRFYPYAIPSLENDTDWTFRIPDETVQGDFAYYIEAFDQVGNHATHPENPTENPHRVTLKPSPYQIVGTVTDTSGNPVPAVKIVFLIQESTSPVAEPSSPELPTTNRRFRYVETGSDGSFSVPVKPGVWEVRVSHSGFAPAEAIKPIDVKNEGAYELHIVLVPDSEPPVIVHHPADSYTFGEPMVVQAQVTDNHAVRSVALRLFREFDSPIVISNEGGIGEGGEVPAEPGRGTLPPSQEVGAPIPVSAPPPIPPVNGAEGGEVKPDFPPIIVEPTFPFDGEIDFPIDLKPPRPGYFEYIPMETTDGTNYTVDIRHYLYGPFMKDIPFVSYVIQAVDVAGGHSLSPENAPVERSEIPDQRSGEAMYTVPLTIPQAISGTVMADGKPLAGIQVTLTDGQTVKLFTYTAEDGSYHIPAAVGTNRVFIVSFGYEVIFPEGGSHEIAVTAGQRVEGIDFRLKPSPFEPPTAEVGSTRKHKEDINDDASIDIFDLVLIGSNLGKQIGADSAEAPSGPNPDVNGDGVVDIFDLVLVASRFGEKLSEAAPPRPIGTIDAQVEATLLNRSRSTATLALQLKADTKPFTSGLYGVQFDLTLHADGAKLLAVQKGNLLGADDDQSFWHAPALQGNVAKRAATVALRSGRRDKPTGQLRPVSLRLAIITLQLDRISFGGRAKITIDNLILVDADGHGVLAQTQPIPIDLETLLLPDHNQLLQNYPNPFNPETWIPYQMSRDATVRIEIYNTLGQIVRTLEVGHRPAGVYASRGRAAYWDGTNNLGERVASGVYFYAIQAGNFHAVKRMVIMK